MSFIIFPISLIYLILIPPLMEHIEIIQYQAALAITGSWQGNSHKTTYLHEGILFTRLKFLYVILINKKMCNACLKGRQKKYT